MTGRVTAPDDVSEIRVARHGSLLYGATEEPPACRQRTGWRDRAGDRHLGATAGRETELVQRSLLRNEPLCGSAGKWCTRLRIILCGSSCCCCEYAVTDALLTGSVGGCSKLSQQQPHCQSLITLWYVLDREDNLYFTVWPASEQLQLASWHCGLSHHINALH